VSDAGEGEARRVASELEKIRSVYQLVVGPEVEPGDPILVFASADAEGFEALLPAKWREEGRTRWAGLFLEAPSGYTLLLRLDLRGASASGPCTTSTSTTSLAGTSAPSSWLNEVSRTTGPPSTFETKKSSWGVRTTTTWPF
jgi:hypothetical protein